MLSNAQITQFQTIYKKHFNKDLTDKEALFQAMQLLNLFKIIFKNKPTMEVAELLRDAQTKIDAR